VRAFSIKALCLITIVAEDLKHIRVVILDDPGNCVCPANFFLQSVSGATTILMIDRQESKFCFSAAGTLAVSVVVVNLLPASTVVRYLVLSISFYLE
jgi:hypothetical protein